MKSFDIFHLVLCRLCQVETIILISNFSAKPWLTLQRLENLRPTQAISLWSQGAKEGVPAVAQQKCFSSGVFNLPTRPCWKLLGSVQKACYLPGAEWKTNFTPGAKFTPPAELAEMLLQMDQGRKPEQLPLLAMNSHPLTLPAEHSSPPPLGQQKPCKQSQRQGQSRFTGHSHIYCGQGHPCGAKPWAPQWSHKGRLHIIPPPPFSEVTATSHVSRKAEGAHTAKFLSWHLSWYQTAHLQDCQHLEMVQGSCHSNLSITHYCPSRFCKMSAQAKSLHPLILK